MARPKISGDMIRRIELYCDAAGSDKIYIVTLTEEAQGRFRVWYEHGPRGHVNSGGEKTDGVSVTEPKARGIFDRLVTEKSQKGYRVINDHSWPTTSGAQAAAPAKREVKRAPKIVPKIPANPLGANSRAVLNSIF